MAIDSLLNTRYCKLAGILVIGKKLYKKHSGLVRGSDIVDIMVRSYTAEAQNIILWAVTIEMNYVII